MRRKYMIFASLFHIDYGTEQFSVEGLDNCVSVDDIENKMAENKYSDLWFFGESSNKYFMEIRGLRYAG